jgi:hypothetical protein
MSGCAGSVVTYLITLTWDNCACQIAVPPLVGAPVTYISALSDNLGWPAIFALAPGWTGGLLKCTPDPNPGCTAWPATGRLVTTFSVAVTIPPDLPPGTVDTHTVIVDIGPNRTITNLSTTVIGCAGCGKCIPPKKQQGIGMSRPAGAGPVSWLGAFPNPLRSTGSLRFAVRESGPVQVTVYDVTGRRTVKLTDSVLDAGTYLLPWSGSDASGHDLPNGVYFVALQQARARDLQKVVIAR